MPGLAAVEDVDPATGLREAPADSEPDYSGADDRRPRAVARGWIESVWNGGLLSLA
jgi:hypothetical protein